MREGLAEWREVPGLLAGALSRPLEIFWERTEGEGQSYGEREKERKNQGGERRVSGSSGELEGKEEIFLEVIPGA